MIYTSYLLRWGHKYAEAAEMLCAAHSLFISRQPWHEIHILGKPELKQEYAQDILRGHRRNVHRVMLTLIPYNTLKHSLVYQALYWIELILGVGTWSFIGKERREECQEDKWVEY